MCGSVQRRSEEPVDDERAGRRSGDKKKPSTTAGKAEE
jgi:hypothetical protein